MQNTHFYHRSIAKYIAAFGSIFNNLTLVKYDKSHTTEIKRTKVPIFFGPREKYLVKIREDNRKVQATLPLMSFNMTGLDYDPTRKTNSLLRHPKANTVSGNADTVYNGVPYNLSFDLYILARNKDDAYQIIEQILPSFQSSFIFSQIIIPEIGFVKDIPVILNSITDNVQYDNDFDEIITVEYALSFTMQVYFYGPVSNTAVIKRAFANTFLDPSLYAGAIIRVNVDNGNNGTFKLEDIVYQGNTLREASAAGVVYKWDANNAYLSIGGVQGTFKTNNTIKAASTNAEYNLASFDVTPLKVQSIKIEPDPIDANVGDPFGFTETIFEHPDTEL